MGDAIRLLTQSLWLVPVGAVVILISDLIGNLITFKHKYGNALVTSIIWGVAFILVLFLIVEVGDRFDINYDWNPRAWSWALMGMAFAFVSDVVGNHISFSEAGGFRPRIQNALVTTIVWSVLFFVFLIVLDFNSNLV